MAAAASNSAARIARRPGIDPEVASVASGILDQLQSPASALAYAADLADFLDWCDTRELHPFAAGRGDISAYHADLRARTVRRKRTPGFSSATRRRRIAVLRKFYREAIERRIVLGPNPAEGQTGFGDKRDKGQAALTREEAARLLANAALPVEPPEERLRAHRNRIILLLAVYTAARSKELRGLRWSDLERHGRYPSLHVLGKGDKPYQAKVSPELLAELDAWHEALGAAGIELHGDDPILIPLRRGWPPRPKRVEGVLAPMSASLVFRIVDRALDDIDRKGNRSGPHLLRRTSVTLVWQATGDLAMAQRHARHSSPTTTEAHYIKPADELEDTGIDHLHLPVLAPDAR